MFGLGYQELLLILVIVLILFGGLILLVGDLSTKPGPKCVKAKCPIDDFLLCEGPYTHSTVLSGFRLVNGAAYIAAHKGAVTLRGPSWRNSNVARTASSGSTSSFGKA